MKIEQLKKSEILIVSDLLNKIGKCYVPTLTEQIGNLENYVQKIVDNSTIFIVTVDNIDIALISFYCNNFRDKKAFISSFGVDISYQGKGVAQKLMNYTITYLKKLGFDSIELEVHKHNGRAMRFYENNDFVITKENNNSFFMKRTIL